MHAIGDGSTGSFVWPKNDDIIKVSAEKIISELPPPEPISSRYLGRKTDILKAVDGQFFVGE